jgi:hypothetical protein
VVTRFGLFLPPRNGTSHTALGYLVTMTLFDKRRRRRRHRPAQPVPANPALDTREKDSERFYLLPGMGGKAYRRKRNQILAASITVGLIVSGLFALVVWWLNRPHK